LRTSLDAGAGAFLLNDANVSRDLSKWKFIGNHLEPDNSLILANVSSQDNNLESGVKSIIRQKTHISAAQLDNLVDCIGLHKNHSGNNRGENSELFGGRAIAGHHKEWNDGISHACRNAETKPKL
jgi:hypothetical protein